MQYILLTITTVFATQFVSLNVAKYNMPFFQI